MIVMNLEPIKGDCKIQGYEDWITLDDCNFEISRDPKESGQTGTQDLHLGMPVCEALELKKTADRATVYLKKLAIGGGALGSNGKCRIAWLTSGLGEADKHPFDKYMEIELTRPILKKYSLESSGNDRPTESLSLMYSKILTTYYERDPKTGAQKKHGPQGWDLVTGKAATS